MRNKVVILGVHIGDEVYDNYELPGLSVLSGNKEKGKN